MAQHDYDIANQTGASFRSDLNLCLDAVQSTNSGSSSPSSTVAYMLWGNTSAGELQIRNAANNGWQGLFTITGNINRDLGIGTNTPSSYNADAHNLVIYQSSGNGGLTIHTGSSNTGAIYFADGSTGDANEVGQINYVHSSNQLELFTNGTRRGVFGSNGTFYNLAVNNTFISESTASADVTYTLFSGNYSATQGQIGTGTQSIAIYTNGNVKNTNNSYTGLSDIKLKENIVDASSQWDDIKGIRVRKYNFKEGQTHTQIGVIAQEVEQISPGLVFDSSDLNKDGEPVGTVTKNVNYSVLYMKSVKALQEAMARIEELEAKVAALEAA